MFAYEANEEQCMNDHYEHLHSDASHLSGAGRALSSDHQVCAVAAATCLEWEDWGGKPENKRLNSDLQ